LIGKHNIKTGKGFTEYQHLETVVQFNRMALS